MPRPGFDSLESSSNLSYSVSIGRGGVGVTRVQSSNLLLYSRVDGNIGGDDSDGDDE